MKHSIKKQFAYTFIGLMTGTILLCWFLNNTFLEKYYVQNKKEALLNAHKRLQEAIDNDKVNSDAFDIELQTIFVKYNISVLVLDADSQTVKSSGTDAEVMGKYLLNNLFGIDKDYQVLEEKENYIIQNRMDNRTKTEYMEMWGMFTNGNLFMLRTALESIRVSASIANRFMIYVGMFAILVSALVTWYVSRKITQPILTLADISDKMTHLDFEAKYTGNSKNEIALLGENINKLSAALESTISELKTANNELMKDIQRKEEIDDMRKEFLSNVSHELKTPLALIQGYAEGLKEGINDDIASREFYCDVIMDEAGKMNTMVKKLLTLNQLEFGNDKVSMERFDIVALLCNYIQSAQILTMQNEIQVRMKQYPPIYVWADEFKTEEVFMNYFTNAVNYATGEKIVEISLEEKEDIVRVSVFNTGSPIPEECISHIWEKFYKVDKARTREYGGNGVGLSIVKAIMDSMNQNYGMKNYDNGVTFWFELEIAKGSE